MLNALLTVSHVFLLTEINVKIMKPCLLWLRDEWTVLESGKALVLPDPKQVLLSGTDLNLESQRV